MLNLTTTCHAGQQWYI